MASSGKPKTTMAKLKREATLRERRLDKATRKQIRKQGLPYADRPSDFGPEDLDREPTMSGPAGPDEDATVSVPEAPDLGALMSMSEAPDLASRLTASEPTLGVRL